jgi:hypothetical protein
MVAHFEVFQGQKESEQFFVYSHHSPKLKTNITIRV